MIRILAITAVVGCKNRCIYCEQEKFVKAYVKRSKITLMSFDVFRTCIEKLPRDTYISFAGFSEPWLNPDCTKMILYAHEKGHKILIYTTGVGMEPADVNQIKHIPFHCFVVHLPDEDYSTKIKVNEHYLSIIEGLQKVNITNLQFLFNPTANGPPDVHPAIRKRLSGNFPFIQNELITRANNISIDGISAPEPISGKLAWCWRLHVNLLLPNGDVTLCCMDMSLKHILGNLLTSSYESLFEGDEFKKVVKGLEDQSIDILCRHCEIAVKQEPALARFAISAKRTIMKPVRYGIKKAKQFHI